LAKLPRGHQGQTTGQYRRHIVVRQQSEREIKANILVSVSAACAVMTFLMLTSPACVFVPVRVPAHERDVSGKPLDLDLTFLKSGSTTRDELTKKLAAVDTGINQSNLFWGRWDSSRWRTTAIGFVPPEGERIWHAQNLLIQFDSKGVVKSWAVVDDKGLTRQLGLLAPEPNDNALDLSSPVQAEVRVRQRDDILAGLVLSSDSFEEWRVTQTNRFSLKTPRTNLLRIEATPEHSYYGPQSGYIPYTRPDLIVATVYLAKSAKVQYGEKSHSVGKKLLLGVDPRTFLLLRRFIQQTNHQTK
jgi:hypothetical protein